MTSFAPELAIERAPLPRDLVAEPILAWRTWVVSHDGQLAGLGRPLAWSAIQPADRAECWQVVYHYHRGETVGSTLKPGGHAAPQVDCSCGYWALKDYDRALGVVGQTLCSFPIHTWAAVAFGRVQLWGTIVETELGYRAEYARPYDLELVSVYGPSLPVDRALLARVRERYHCEATHPRDAEQLQLAIRRAQVEMMAAINIAFGSYKPTSLSPKTISITEKPRRRRFRVLRLGLGLTASAMWGVLAFNSANAVTNGPSPLRLFATAICAFSAVSLTRSWLWWRSRT